MYSIRIGHILQKLLYYRGAALTLSMCQDFSFCPIFGGITYPPARRYGHSGLYMRSFFAQHLEKEPFSEFSLQFGGGR